MQVILKGDPKKLNLHGVRNCPVYIPNTRVSIVLENLEISGIPRPGAEYMLTKAAFKKYSKNSDIVKYYYSLK